MATEVDISRPLAKRQRPKDTNGPWYLLHLADSIDTVLGSGQNQRELVEVHQPLMMEMVFNLGKKYLRNEASHDVVKQLLLHPMCVLIQTFFVTHRHSFLVTKGIAKESKVVVETFMDYLVKLKADQEHTLIKRYRLSKAIHQAATAIITKSKHALDPTTGDFHTHHLQAKYNDNTNTIYIETIELSSATDAISI